MKTLVRLLLAGIVFVTPTAVAAVVQVHNPLCKVLSVPHRAECLLFGQRMIFA